MADAHALVDLLVRLLALHEREEAVEVERGRAAAVVRGPRATARAGRSAASSIPLPSGSGQVDRLVRPVVGRTLDRRSCRDQAQRRPRERLAGRVEQRVVVEPRVAAGGDRVRVLLEHDDRRSRRRRARRCRRHARLRRGGRARARTRRSSGRGRHDHVHRPEPSAAGSTGADVDVTPPSFHASDLRSDRLGDRRERLQRRLRLLRVPAERDDALPFDEVDRREIPAVASGLVGDAADPAHLRRRPRPSPSAPACWSARRRRSYSSNVVTVRRERGGRGRRRAPVGVGDHAARARQASSRLTRLGDAEGCGLLRAHERARLEVAASRRAGCGKRQRGDGNAENALTHLGSFVRWAWRRLVSSSRSNGTRARSATARTASAAPLELAQHDLVFANQQRAEVAHAVCERRDDSCLEIADVVVDTSGQ